MKFLLLVDIFSSTLAAAHDSTDWRTDRKAFRSARLVQAPLVRLAFFQEYPKLPIDPAFMKEKVSQLAGALPAVIDGKTVTISDRGSDLGRELARKFLAQEYTRLGFKVEHQKFESGVNFIAEKKGQDDQRVLVLSAHLDSVGNAGANDDAMGMIAGLAIAQSLNQRQLRHTLRVVAFDREEKGMLGSEHYVQSLPESQRVIGDIQLEMMGVNRRKDGAFHVIDCDKPGSTEITAEIMNAIESLGLPLKRVATCTERSDHASFWNADIPAVVLSENFFGGDGDPCYHQACDQVDDRLDFQYASTIAQAVASAIAKMLEVR